MSLGVNGAALVILSALAVYFDLVRHKIPNFLTFPAMLLGLLYHALSGGWSGLWFSLAGLLLGAALLLVPFAPVSYTHLKRGIEGAADERVHCSGTPCLLYTSRCV